MKLLLNDLSTSHGKLIAPTSCTVDVTLKRLQQFKVQVGDSVNWKNYQNGSVIQKGGFIYEGGPITIPGARVYKSGVTLVVNNGGVATFIQPQTLPDFSVQLYPNPSQGDEKLIFNLLQPVGALKVQLISLTGQVMQLWQYRQVNNGFTVNYDFTDLPKGAYFMQATCDKFTTTKKLVLQ